MKFFYLVIAFSLVILGIGIIYDPVFYDSKHHFVFDFTEIKWPFGIFLTIIGFCLLYVTLRKRCDNSASDFFICPNCRKSYNKKDVSENKCCICGGDLENLDEFYERHPESEDK